MNAPRQPPNDPLPSKQTRAEAAAWIARLRGAPTEPQLRAKYRQWLGKNAEHRRAVKHMAQVWEQAGTIRMRARTDVSAHPTPARSSFWAASTAAMIALVIVTAAHYWRDNALTTAIGQQEVRVLRDGTRVVLNTDTRIEVNFDEHARRVRLVRGEARFDVSKRPSWPFLVGVSDREIRALGTSFIVRHDQDNDLSVTLLEGRISVAAVAADGEAPSQAPHVLDPGQRLVISKQHEPAVDRPQMSQITAWERGRVEFDETPLQDATAEMNRYATTHVMVTSTEIGRLRIGGIFRAGDSEEFVKIVTAAFGLKADRNGADIVLSRAAAATP